VRDGGRKAIAIDGLWTLKLGNESKGYFTASPNAETGGIFGFIVPK
jgi:hypothetical protein